MQSFLHFSITPLPQRSKFESLRLFFYARRSALRGFTRRERKRGTWTDALPGEAVSLRPSPRFGERFPCRGIVACQFGSDGLFHVRISTACPRLPTEADGGSWALRFGERRYNACPKCGANVRGIHSRALSGCSACGTLRFPARTCRTCGFAQPCGIHASGFARPRVCGRANIARSFGRLRRIGRTYGALPHTPPGN